MADGLRDFLLGAQQFQQGTGDYANSAEKIRLLAGREEYQKAIPVLFEAAKSQDPNVRAQALGQLSGFASEGIIDKSDPTYESLARNLLPDQSKVKTPIPLETIKMAVPGKSEEEYAAISKMPREDQELLVKQVNFQQKEAGTERRSARNYALQTEKTGSQQGTKAFDVLNKSEDAFREQDYKIKEIKQALKRGTSIDDNIAFGYIARSVAQEKGPLSDSDIARIQGVTGLPGSIEEFKARFNGDVYAKLSQAQKDNLKKIIETNANNFHEKKAESLAYDLNGLYQSQSRLKDKEGNPSGLLKQRLDAYKKEGVPIDFNKESKTFEVGKTAVTHSGNSADLISAANNIKDESVKKQYLDYFNRNADKEFTEKEIAHIRAGMAGL